MRGIAVSAGAGVGVGVLVFVLVFVFVVVVVSAAATGQALQIEYPLGVLVPVLWDSCRALCRESCCWGPDPGRRERSMTFPSKGNRVKD